MLFIFLFFYQFFQKFVNYFVVVVVFGFVQWKENYFFFVGEFFFYGEVFFDFLDELFYLCFDYVEDGNVEVVVEVFEEGVLRFIKDGVVVVFLELVVVFDFEECYWYGVFEVLDDYVYVEDVDFGDVIFFFGFLDEV